MTYQRFDTFMMELFEALKHGVAYEQVKEMNVCVPIRSSNDCTGAPLLFKPLAELAVAVQPSFGNPEDRFFP